MRRNKFVTNEIFENIRFYIFVTNPRGARSKSLNHKHLGRLGFYILITTFILLCLGQQKTGQSWEKPTFSDIRHRIP